MPDIWDIRCPRCETFMLFKGSRTLARGYTGWTYECSCGVQVRVKTRSDDEGVCDFAYVDVVYGREVRKCGLRSGLLVTKEVCDRCAKNHRREREEKLEREQ